MSSVHPTPAVGNQSSASVPAFLELFTHAGLGMAGAIVGTLVI